MRKRKNSEISDISRRYVFDLVIAYAVATGSKPSLSVCSTFLPIRDSTPHYWLKTPKWKKLFSTNRVSKDQARAWLEREGIYDEALIREQVKGKHAITLASQKFTRKDLPQTNDDYPVENYLDRNGNKTASTTKTVRSNVPTPVMTTSQEELMNNNGGITPSYDGLMEILQDTPAGEFHETPFFKMVEAIAMRDRRIKELEEKIETKKVTA